MILLPALAGILLPLVKGKQNKHTVTTVILALEAMLAFIVLFSPERESVLFAMTGAIITERIYSVPGAGNLLTQAINKYDNGVIVGVTLFYAVLTVVSNILGDVLISMVDPRISFTSKGR